MKRNGASDDDAARIIEAQRRSKYLGLRPPREFIRIRDGDVVAMGQREWRVITAGGHSPEHALFYCEKRQNPDRGRSDPVAHDAIGDRAGGAAGRQPDEGISGFADAARGAAAGHAGAAVARPAVSRAAYTACPAARTSSGAARRRGVRRHRQDDRVCDRAGSIPAGAVRQSAPGIWRGACPSEHAGLDRAG